ncbi:isoprenyl transferase [Aphanothece hegewaldii CCALA 016]|uniref:Isoprenyl transferase n=1 Tax=Aphanothece hegewaldii CCALA 016 TaxID=2107694 RepID=A0A2T1M385_9CHRO|nr:isoprenyl transferase [Aphanothece hegewaldii]PSF39301.1 isoprenyl transferase [Aphanothece hegewaldii CCALA 016]
MKRSTSTSTLIQNLPLNIPNSLPRHVAIIMDGNGRWATQRGLPRIAGHYQGAEVVKDILRCCKEWGIKILTVYAFSTENWGRPTAEVDFLMGLFERLLRVQLKEMQQEGICLRFLGELDVLPLSLQREMQRTIDITSQNQEVYFNVAINYSGRQEIVRACRHLAKLVQQGELLPDAIDETIIQQSLYTLDLPSPDLLIRTSGEMRLSNFLLWQLAYTEIYFTNTLWGDFNCEEFRKAIEDYQGRERRFGKL